MTVSTRSFGCRMFGAFNVATPIRRGRNGRWIQQKDLTRDGHWKELWFQRCLAILQLTCAGSKWRRETYFHSGIATPPARTLSHHDRFTPSAAAAELTRRRSRRRSSGGSPGVPHCLFLDSCLRPRRWGASLFVAADPFDFIARAGRRRRALAALAERIRPFAAAAGGGTGSASGTLPLSGRRRRIDRLRPGAIVGTPAAAAQRHVPRACPGGRALQRGADLRPRDRPGVDRFAGFPGVGTVATSPPRGGSDRPVSRLDRRAPRRTLKATRPETEAVSQRELSAQHAVAGGLKPPYSGLRSREG